MRRSSCSSGYPTAPCQRNVLQTLHPPAPPAWIPSTLPSPQHRPPISTRGFPSPPAPRPAPNPKPKSHTPAVLEPRACVTLTLEASSPPWKPQPWLVASPRQGTAGKCFSPDTEPFPGILKGQELNPSHCTAHGIALQGQPFPPLAFPWIGSGMLLLRDAPDLLQDGGSHP